MAVEIQVSNPGRPELAEQPTAGKGADNAESDVRDQPLTLLVDDFATDEAGNQTENDPG